MNEQLYSSLGIDKNADLKTVLDALEEKQFEYLERSETVSDDSRKEEISSILKQIDEEIATVKEQIKSISSSLILDEAENDSSAKSEEKVKEAAEKKEKVASRVDSLKQKEAEKQAKEAEKKKKEAEKAAQKQQAQASQNNNQNSGATSNAGPAPAPVKQVSNTSTDITNGINSYNNQDYTTAFKVFKEMSEKGDASAQYLVAIMYLNGLGTSKDTDRALFWLKKSAETGEPAGQATYGALLVSSNDSKDINTGFKYLQMVSDKGDTDAMIDYVNACLNGKGGKKEVTKAMDYCEKLKLATDDSFNKKKFDDAKTQLKSIKKNAGKNAGSTNSGSSSSSSYGGGYKRHRRFRIPWKLIIIVIIGIVIFKSCGGDDKQKSNTKTDNNTAIEQQIEYKTVRITVADGNVRSGAGTDYDVIAGVHQGEEYFTTGSVETASNGRIWYEIFLDENQSSTGWVSEKIAELNE